MPQLKDCVSKLTLSPEVAYQESYSTTILKWMQDHPEQTKRTTAAKIAKAMTLARATKQSEQHIRMTLYNMVNRGILEAVGGKGRAKKTFFINYLHKTIPKEVLDRAPGKEIKQHEELAGVKLREDEDEEPKPVEVEKEEPKPAEVEKEETEDVPVPAVPEMNVPIELDKMPNGNFTLQLNINFTINSKG